MFVPEHKYKHYKPAENDMYNTILFDYDGTLVENSWEIYEGVRYIFLQCGLNPPTFEEYCQEYGFPYVDFYRTRGITVEEEQLNVWFLEASIYRSRPLFSDVYEVFPELCKRNCLLGIVTANSADFVRRSCVDQGLGPYIHDILGAVKVETPHDKASLIEYFCRVHQRDPSNTFYVGDYGSDMSDAVRGGVFGIGITRGNPSESGLWRNGAQVCIEHLGDLLYLF